MSKDRIHIDEHGLPVLNNVVDPLALPAEREAAPATPQDDFNELLNSDTARQLIENLGNELHASLVETVKATLKKELTLKLDEALRASETTLHRTLDAELQTAIPELLSRLSQQTRK